MNDPNQSLPTPEQVALFAALNNISPDRLLNPQQAAHILRVEPSTLSVWRCTGRYQLPFVKMGRKVFYRFGDLQAFIASRTFENTGEVQ